MCVIEAKAGHSGIDPDKILHDLVEFHGPPPGSSHPRWDRYHRKTPFVDRLLEKTAQIQAQLPNLLASERVDHVGEWTVHPLFVTPNPAVAAYVDNPRVPFATLENLVELLENPTPPPAGPVYPGVNATHPTTPPARRSTAATSAIPAAYQPAICIRNPWPGIFQTIWGQPERFVQIYYERYCRNKDSTDWRDWPYLAGDGAVQSADGYFRILGRTDDVINVSGHRLGTKELESASLTVDEIAEAAAIPVVDELRGRAVEMYVSLKPGHTPSPDIETKVIQAIEREIGKIARPANVWIVPDMPKTRSGKIMRRVIAAVSNFTDVGDTTTLANPEIVENIRHHVQSAKLARGQVPRELTTQEAEEIQAFGHAE